jgi:fibronectin-binding autotransporter adhesin
MKTSNRNLSIPSLAAALSLFAFALPALAAEKTWSGAGADANWATGANWGGTAPVNTDSLIFSGVTQQDNTNNISNLSVGATTFANGGFTLNGNAFTSAGSTSAFFTNSAGINTIACALTTTAPGGRYFVIAPGSELRLTGVVTNTAASGTSVGWLNLTNGGTVRIMNSAKSTRGMDLFHGTVIIDGSAALVDAINDGLRFKPPTGLTAAVIITNNGTLRVGGGGNVRLGHNGTGIGGIAGAGSWSRIDMSSGLLELYGANVNVLVGDLVSGATGLFNHDGGVVWGSAGSGNAVTLGNSAGADGTYNLNGGVLWIAQVRQGNAGAANAVFNFNGGTLKPTGSSATFMQGLLNANVQNGGAIIDTTNFNITIAQNLQAAGSGGLTKLGSGTLTLSGYNNYTGPTIVTNGSLVTSSSSFAGGGAITVSGNANLSVLFNGGSLLASTLTIGSSATNSVTLDFGPSPSPGGSPVISATTLTASGTALINIAGLSFASGTYPLISFTSASGLSSIKLGTLPLGVSGTLVQIGNTLNLNIALAPKNLAWSGAIDGNWNSSTFNWADLNNGNNPTNFAQSGSSGDMVTFDDTVGAGVTAIIIPGTVTPSAVTVNNNVSYTMSGAGKISGATALTKSGAGFGAITLSTANDYTGGTTVNAGSIYVGNNQALGSGALTMNLGILASDSTTGRTLSNSVVQNANVGVILGDIVNTGALTLAGNLDFGGGTARTLNFNSDVILTGSLTNGGFTTKTGPGSLIMKGNSANAALASQQQGDVIVDGAQFTNNDGWRLQNTLAGSTIRTIITNGGVFNTTIAGNTGNLRVGLTAGDNSADNVLDISGTVNLAPQAAAVAGNNAVILGQSGANASLNLRSGGLLITRALFGNAPANSEAHFLGGTMRAIANDSGFIAGLTNAFMDNGGLTIDTTNFSVTVPQALLASGSGGLTKTGSGTLTLSGANTYAGNTVVNAGKLVLGSTHASTGGITVASNAVVAFLSSTPGGSVKVPGVTAQHGSQLEAQFGGGSSNPTVPAGYVTNLVLSGSVGVNLAGSGLTVGQFPLFGYGSISGSGSIVIGQLPQGVIGTLTTNTGAKTIDLVVTSVTPILWTGTISGSWDLTTTNWTLNASPTTFKQNDSVVFGDAAANSVVALAQTLTPGSMVVSNSGLAYTFNGAGSLSGSMGLVKMGTNTVTLSTANTYSGPTTVSAGRLVAGTATALGADTAGTTIQSGASLDVAANNLGLEPVIVGGSGVDGVGALINSGADQNNALRDVTLTSDVVIHADGSFGIRMPADTDPGLRGNGHKLTKTGANALNLNGGQTNPGTTIWDCDLGDVDVLEGTVSFQRRMTMGRSTNSYRVAVSPGASLLLFALDTTMPVQTKAVYLTNATLSANGNNAAEGTTFGGPITLVSGSNSVAALTGVTLRLQGPITGSGELHNNSSAAGIVALEANNTYTGQTVVEAGILRLESTAQLSATPSIRAAGGATFDVTAFAPWTLAAPQTLAGGGTIAGTVLALGTISPGNNSTRNLTFSGDLALGGNCLMELNKDSGLTNDTVTVSGTLTYGGQLTVALTGSTPLAVNDTFKLFNFVSPPGGSFTFNFPAGYSFDTSQLALDGSIRVTAVPSVRPHPGFTSVSTSGGSVILSGTNATGTYVLYSSTNVALPIASWTPVVTNTFSGNFSITNIMDTAQKFYLLQ